MPRQRSQVRKLRREEFAKIARALAAARRAVMYAFYKAGFTKSQIGQFYGISKQRVDQILGPDGQK